MRLVGRIGLSAEEGSSTREEACSGSRKRLLPFDNRPRSEPNFRQGFRVAWFLSAVKKRLKQFVETYSGSSFPTRCETTEDEVCVLKMRGAGNGSGALLSEFIVNRLGARIGLAIPDASVIDIAAGFPWTFGTDEFHDLVQKSSGANLALQWIRGATACLPNQYRSLPDELVSQIVTIDFVFENADRTFQSRNLLVDHRGRYWIVDHGSCRFLARNPDQSPRLLPLGHIFTDRAAAFDRRWLAPITPALIKETTEELPEVWLRDAGLTRDEVFQRILARARL